MYLIKWFFVHAKVDDATTTMVGLNYLIEYRCICHVKIVFITFANEHNFFATLILIDNKDRS